jgi:hypothetical protein
MKVLLSLYFNNSQTILVTCQWTEGNGTITEDENFMLFYFYSYQRNGLPMAFHHFTLKRNIKLEGFKLLK